MVSNTCIDWFFPWPEEALVSVATNYLKEEKIEDELKLRLISHIVLVHTSVQQFSKDFEI